MIGSMIPDFPMFYPIASYSFSHSAIGLIGYCLPMGIVVYYLWELLGKALTIDVSPLWIRYRINDYRSTKPRYTFVDILVVAIALIVGSITHTVWDAFTHKGEWGVELMPWLDQQTAIFALPGYKVFQYGSTFIGLPLLAVLCFIYLKNNRPDTHSQYYPFPKSWLLAIAISFVAICIAIAGYQLFQVDSLKTIIGITLKQSISAGITMFFLYAILYKIWRGKTK